MSGAPLNATAAHPCCAYGGCTTTIQSHRFFCWPHWRCIPLPLRQDLAAAQSRRFATRDAGPLRPELERLLASARTAIAAHLAQRAAATAVRADAFDEDVL